MSESIEPEVLHWLQDDGFPLNHFERRAIIGRIRRLVQERDEALRKVRMMRAAAHDTEESYQRRADRLTAEKATLREALQSAPAALIEAFECGASRAHNDTVEGRYSDDPDVAREWLDEVRFDPHSNAYTILAAAQED